MSISKIDEHIVDHEVLSIKSKSQNDLAYLKLNQTTPQTVGNTSSRMAKLWATDLTVTNVIDGSINGNSATVTTNANLTGVITSSGNATSIASQTGTGSKFVVDTSPTIVTPVIASLVGNKIYPAADSTTAIQINRADGTTNVLNVDTTIGNILVGTTDNDGTPATGRLSQRFHE